MCIIPINEYDYQILFGNINFKYGVDLYGLSRCILNRCVSIIDSELLGIEIPLYLKKLKVDFCEISVLELEIVIDRSGNGNSICKLEGNKLLCIVPCIGSSYSRENLLNVIKNELAKHYDLYMNYDFNVEDCGSYSDVKTYKKMINKYNSDSYIGQFFNILKLKQFNYKNHSDFIKNNDIYREITTIIIDERLKKKLLKYYGGLIFEYIKQNSDDYYCSREFDFVML